MTNPNNERKELERQAEVKRKHEAAKALVKLSMTPDEIKDEVIEDDYRFARENPDYVRDLIRHAMKDDSDEQILETYMDYIFDWEDFENGTNK